MKSAPNWFLYVGYFPPENARVFTVLAIAQAIGLRERKVAATLSPQHGRVESWVRLPIASERKPLH